MPTIYQQWREFAALVMPRGVTADSVQYGEMQKAFYAGFFACLKGCQHLPATGLSDEAQVAQLEAWLAECHRFYRAVEGE